jgi:hypothetical protein
VRKEKIPLTLKLNREHLAEAQHSKREASSGLRKDIKLHTKYKPYVYKLAVVHHFGLGTHV